GVLRGAGDLRRGPLLGLGQIRGAVVQVLQHLRKLHHPLEPPLELAQARGDGVDFAAGLLDRAVELAEPLGREVGAFRELLVAADRLLHGAEDRLHLGDFLGLGSGAKQVPEHRLLLRPRHSAGWTPVLARNGVRLVALRGEEPVPANSLCKTRARWSALGAARRTPVRGCATLRFERRVASCKVHGADEWQTTRHVRPGASRRRSDRTPAPVPAFFRARRLAGNVGTMALPPRDRGGILRLMKTPP